MNSIEKLQKLETQLEQAKAQYKSDALYSEAKLQELQLRAKEQHPKHEQFHCCGPRDFALIFQDKLSKGYTYIDHQASALPFANGHINLQLQRPDDVVQSELIELERKIRDQYLSDIENNENKLSIEIARLRLEIKRTQAEIKADTKAQTDFEKELEKVKQELRTAEEVQSPEASNG